MLRKKKLRSKFNDEKENLRENYFYLLKIWNRIKQKLNN